MVLGIEHAAIAAKDVERLAAFYVRTLGFEINYRGKTAIFVKASDGTMIEIIPAEGELSESAPKSARGCAIWHCPSSASRWNASAWRLPG